MHDAIIEKLNEIADELNAPIVKVFRYVHPKILVPAICTKLNLDTLEFSDVVFDELSSLVKICGMTKGFSKLYYPVCLHLSDGEKKYIDHDVKFIANLYGVCARKESL